MEKLDMYRRYVQQVLEEYAQYKPSVGEIELQPIFDTERDHYQLVTVGWVRRQRQHGILVHIDVKNDQIWIQYDGTERGLANDFVALGVPKEDIVLAFHPPHKWRYTGFGEGREEKTPTATSS